MSLIEWRDVFDDIFQDYSDTWSLNQAHRNDKNLFNRLQTQNCLTQTRYAGFHCPKCSHYWTSARAKVDLYYPKSHQSLGQVKLRLYGQECLKCSRKMVYYVDPIFSIDVIQIILEKLHERVGWFCYGKERPEKTVTDTSDRGRVMNGPHEKELCEACKMGRCDQV
ncbi:unnamed protein product [Adineta ricciae]|uniref:3CxxC-type domain-containing protein n=1 Tax=Adineta ricciae TaxID=249248 RepID=A0A814E2J1_ADIRI|nr:unnamed protein product [Adineta ricciae]CAF1010809.1 unnamed protein product [Adineta ricciae]